MVEPSIEVLVASAAHFPHAESIARAIRDEVEQKTIGMALRTPELLREKMRDGDAVIAIAGPEWAGFCYISPWEEGRFVSTSALIVRGPLRGAGLARRLKERALRLSGERYPEAAPFGLSTSRAVVRINRELGFDEVPYAELPQDPDFWKGCESCPLHSVLVANSGKTCHCTATLVKGSAQDSFLRGPKG